MTFDHTRRAATVRGHDGDGVRDAELPGRIQYDFRVVDEQRARRVEVMACSQRVPEALVFLRMTKVVGAVDVGEVILDPGNAVFDS